MERSSQLDPSSDERKGDLSKDSQTKVVHSKSLDKERNDFFLSGVSHFITEIGRSNQGECEISEEEFQELQNEEFRFDETKMVSIDDVNEKKDTFRGSYQLCIQILRVTALRHSDPSFRVRLQFLLLIQQEAFRKLIGYHKLHKAILLATRNRITLALLGEYFNLVSFLFYF